MDDLFNDFPEEQKEFTFGKAEGGSFMDTKSYYREEAFRHFQEAYQKQTEGLVDEAIELYQKSLDILATAEAHTFLGWAYSFQGRYEEAIRECRLAIEVDPDYGNPYNDIGAYLIEKGEWDQAIPWLERALGAKRYESYCFPHYNLGRIWEHKGDWFRAVASYRNALKAKPDYTLAKRALGRVEGMMN